MKALFILTTTIFCFAASAQQINFNPDTQELVVKFEKKRESTKQGRLLQAILNNSETIQLKDGTIISIKDLSNKLEQVGGDGSGGSLEKLERELERVSGSGGGGTGAGG